LRSAPHTPPLLLEIEGDEKINPVEKMRETFEKLETSKTMSSPVTTISEVGMHDGQSVTIRGWLYNLRESGKLLFPQLRDGSGVIQGVVPKNAVTAEVFEAVKTLTQESSVIVEGKVRADKR